MGPDNRGREHLWGETRAGLLGVELRMLSHVGSLCGLFDACESVATGEVMSQPIDGRGCIR